MPKTAYINKHFHRETREIIERANSICEEYAALGFVLTLRQLYYQFVARGLLLNKQAEYKRLGEIVNDGRVAGLIDWEHLEDRTRYIRDLSHWNNPADIIDNAARSYREHKWDRQPYRPEVWIEKDALVGVIEGICENNDVPYFSCRGYTSQSEMWNAAQRLLRYVDNGQIPLIFHLGDHDPSGLDMSRDLLDRLNLFMGPEKMLIKRLALNMDQVQQYTPPPNPAKTTDARYIGYMALHGKDSWELDALEPTVLATLIQNAIDEFRDMDLWAESLEEEEQNRHLLHAAASYWAEITRSLLGPQGENSDA